jgi:FkbM family methyltransferase
MSMVADLGWRALDRLAAKSGLRLTRRIRAGRMSCPLTDMIGRRIFLFGVWEPEMTAYVEATLRPGRVFIDVGANIGYYSMLASRLVGLSGSVVAIEPSPTNFSELKRNIALNHALNIRAIDMAVGDESSVAPLYQGPKSNRGRTGLLERPGFIRECVVRIEPLRALLTANEIARTQMIKVDVEGAELPVLRSIIDLMPDLPHDVEIMVELAPSVVAAPEFSEMRAALAEFTAYQFKNPYDIEFYTRWREPAPLRESPLTGSRSANVVFRRSHSGR